MLTRNADGISRRRFVFGVALRGVPKQQQRNTACPATSRSHKRLPPALPARPGLSAWHESGLNELSLLPVRAIMISRVKLTVRTLAACCAIGVIVSPVSAQATTADCTPTLVGTVLARVHVRCAAPVSGGVIFFAARTGDMPFADRFLKLASDALIAKRTLVIHYDPNDTSGPTWGCAIVECRPASGISMR
jgi:hypothetical protein